MTALNDLTALPKAAPCWDSILREVNAWRGACLHSFTLVEYAASETLLVLHRHRPEGTTIRLRHLVGQRLEDLAAAIADGGPFAAKGKTLARNLKVFRDRHEALRVMLCHDQMTVALEFSGRWLVVARRLQLKSGQPDYRTTVVTQAEALACLADLKADGQKLVSQLGNLRKLVQAV